MQEPVYPAHQSIDDLTKGITALESWLELLDDRDQLVAEAVELLDKLWSKMAGEVAWSPDDSTLRRIVLLYGVDVAAEAVAVVAFEDASTPMHLHVHDDADALADRLMAAAATAAGEGT